MFWCNTISLRHLSPPHSLNTLGLGRMLKSTSGTEPSPLPHTHDAAPIKSKVAPQLTASQGIGYHSMAHTVYSSHHQEGHRRHTDRRTSVDTLYIVITTQVPLHIACPAGGVDRHTDTSENITFPILRMRKVISIFLTFTSRWDHTAHITIDPILDSTRKGPRTP